MNPEQRMGRALVGLADTLAADFDVVDLAHRLCLHSVALLPIGAAVLLLSDPGEGFQVIAASADEAHMLGLVDLEAGGPSSDSFRSAEPIVNSDATPWPAYRTAMIDAGFTACHAVPIRHCEQALGALTMLGSDSLFRDADMVRAQTLCDVVAIGILQDRCRRRQTLLVEQLQTALESRLLIERAKGILAERAGIDVETAFRVVREYARRNHQSLHEVAGHVVDGTLNDLARTAIS